MSQTFGVTVAHGDGVGQEAMIYVLQIMKEIGAPIKIDSIEIGSELYRKGYSYGISNAGLEIIKKNPFFLKSSAALPKHEDFQDPTLFIINEFDLFCEVNDFSSLKNLKNSLSLVSLNNKKREFDVEYRHTDDMYVVMSFVNQSKRQAIIEYLFDHAVAFNKKNIAFVSSKRNYLKTRQTNERLKELISEYKKIKLEKFYEDEFLDLIAYDNLDFNLIFIENFFDKTIENICHLLYKNDANCFSKSFIGSEKILFETPNQIEENLKLEENSNFFGLLNSAINLLIHIGEAEKASIIKNALLFTIESGMRTKCMKVFANNSVSIEVFAKKLISNFGKVPKDSKKDIFFSSKPLLFGNKKKLESKGSKLVIAVELFIEFESFDIDFLAETLLKYKPNSLSLRVIKNNNKIVWPSQNSENIYSSYFRCVFAKENIGQEIQNEELLCLISNLFNANIDVSNFSKLYSFDGLPGFLPISC